MDRDFRISRLLKPIVYDNDNPEYEFKNLGIMEKKNNPLPISENFHLERIEKNGKKINILRLITQQGPSLVFVGDDKEFVEYLSTMQR